METLYRKGTENWRIRHIDEHDFFVEADLPNAEENGHYPRLEVMQDDFGEHNGYTREMRLEDAETIVNAKKSEAALQNALQQIEKLEAEKAELVEALKDVYLHIVPLSRFLEEPYKKGLISRAEKIESLIQKHKQ